MIVRRILFFLAGATALMPGMYGPVREYLARVLAHPAELLVLDEPTNHLDLGAVAWLEQRLLSFGGGLVLVTHDRHLLDRVSTRML